MIRLLQAKQHSTQDLLHRLQCKLMVGASGDQYEQEAERVARQVVNMLDAAVMPASVRDEDRDEKTQTKPVAGTITRLVERSTAADEEKEQLHVQQISPQSESFETGPETEAQLSESKGHGNPLPDNVRNFMEPRFGADFGAVRVHTGSEAIQMNRALGARAFAHGQEIYYGAGQCPSDFALTAHELAHVVQQAGATPLHRMRGRDPPELRPSIQRACTGLIQRQTDFREQGERQSDVEMPAVGGSESHEIEANRVADQVVSRMSAPSATVARLIIPSMPSLGIPGLGSGVPLSPDLRRSYEAAFGWSFAGVRLHSGQAAAKTADGLGALAFTRGRDIVFGGKVENPEASPHQHTLAHELAHVVQQDRGAASGVQAQPRVTVVTPSALELGVGGRDITATATVAAGAPANPPITWTINPGGAVPAGVSIVGTGRRVSVRAAQPGPGTVVGGTPITLRAALAAPPGDFADSAAVMLVQVTGLVSTPAPALVPIPSGIAGAPPPNTGEPNRDGIAGNTVVVAPTVLPGGRPDPRITFRRSLGATVAGLTITPGRQTGDLQLRITDAVTGARFDETTPSVAGGAALMADFTINAVPTGANSLTLVGPLGPYGALNQFGWAASDASGAGGRVIGELMSLQENTLGIQLAGPNGWNAPIGFNAGAPNLGLSVPANLWQDQVTAGAGLLTPTGAQAIDVNRFMGPGVPPLPRRLTTGQAFVYFSWAGGGAVFSNVFDRGIQRRSLVGPGANGFVTEQIFPGARTTRPEPYVGNPLINLVGLAVGGFTPAGATALAADGFATANLTVNVQDPTGTAILGRLIVWTVLSGPITLSGGAAPAPPGGTIIQAGLTPGTARVRGVDSVHPNRQVLGNVPVARVRVRGMAGVPARVPVGTLATIINLNADPGGRTIQWILDGAALAAGVRVVPNPPGPPPAESATVTRPAGFTGRVTVTATDSVIPAASASASVQFL